ncbi:4-hydroxy-3-methylbut-2-enyl diphosphate reductase [Luteibaculum oceani]|uniref:4-hydroxy-3-methylbut-2-enyl diphosphate reductase n=1 Tax=Luteibaculum oceani TaxID=1294296 RepID=A0A5C6UWJ1_9FLAO|nr:4-hydroxy-3-methylbut-2-enyl diphosphate reductase [Luteibaculum oceani]TXC76950.1 4-hydroxy-3-methylbut-2-enyl diphosphate reductase [Luteibaculum oceani]
MRSFDIPEKYKSEKIAAIKAKRKADDPKKKDFTPSYVDFEKFELILARHFGFCFGVENAIERAYKALAENPGKRIFLLSQMIHNPAVNKDLEENGIRFIMDTEGKQFIPWEEISKEDIVLIPAFGTTLEIEGILAKKGIDAKTYDTTCPFVEKVWNRSAKLGKDQYTVIIHGKPKHEETRATFSHAAASGPALVVKDMGEAQLLGGLMLKNAEAEEYAKHFGERVNPGFSFEQDLNKVGVVNQTTMLASDTQAIADYFKTVMEEKFGTENIKEHFADTRDTLCYATNDNQNATLELLKEPADLALVVGGYNSSNTSHIVELCEQKFPTYFIKGPECLESIDIISHWNYPAKKNEISKEWYPKGNKKPRIIITSGASCPDSLLEAVLNRLIEIS